MENIYKIAMEVVEKFEGLVLHPYYCSANKLTISFGERIDLRPDKKYGGIYGRQLVEKCEQILAKVGGNVAKANKLIAKEYPNLVTEEESKQWLYEALKDDYWNQFGKDLPHGLTDNQCAALLSFVYNIGLANFRRSTMYKLLQEGKIDKAGLEFKKWVFAGGKKLNGLVNRRIDEQALYFK